MTLHTTIFFLFLTTFTPAQNAPPHWQPAPGEKVALVGGSAGEVIGQEGTFEALLQARFAMNEMVVRNFCRPADEVGVRQRPGNYTTIDDPLEVFGPDTFICFFGSNESYAGMAGMDQFVADYGKFLDDTAKAYPAKGGAPRFVLVSPTAVEASGEKWLPDGTRKKENRAAYAKSVAALAARRGLPFVDVFSLTGALFGKEPGLQFTTDGVRLSPGGAQEVAMLLDRALFQTPNPARPGPAFDQLRAACADKAWVHAQDYRMLNGWYVYGGRRTHDKETFPREFAKIRAMAAVRDRYVRDLALGQPVAAKPDDSKTGELFVPRTMFGTQPKKEPKELKYPTPEESIATMKVPPGFEVQLVASEREFPALANVNQVNVDNRGRLRVSCMATYPKWKPGGPRPNDRLVILDELDPKTGRAAKAVVFTDRLICPTGFEFWNGGVIVVDEPRLLWLKDTDGDDKADLEVVLSDGRATDDTHHTIGAFEWSPGGLLHMLEGVSMSTAVETPWGPYRRAGKPGCYILDQRTRQFPDDWQGAFMFACVINKNGLTTFTVGGDGAGFKGTRRKGGDLLRAENNITFRPTDPQIGADGALYFGDWSAALIGHMQYSQRDPNRDHSHGRVFRLVYKNKPLLPLAAQYGKTVPQLLAQLGEYEPRTRYRARRELRDRPTAEVLAAIKALDPADDRMALECPWVQQGHHAVEGNLLKRVLRAKTPEARAAATRVLADEWDRIPGAAALMKEQVTDNFARTRCEAIRALSFIPTRESVEMVLTAAGMPRDYWIDYTLDATLSALEPVWKPLLASRNLTATPAGFALLSEMEHAGKPAGAAVAALKKFLAAPDIPEEERKTITAEIAGTKSNADNGKAVFRRICITCHKWGGEGLEYGPSIDGLAVRMKRADIVESILEPNAIVAPQFVTTTVETQAGGAFAGFIAGETTDTLLLKVAGGAMQPIKLTDIKKRETQKVSSMPEGLANAMSPEEFLDLIEFLSPSGKAKP